MWLLLLQWIMYSRGWGVDVVVVVVIVVDVVVVLHEISLILQSRFA